MSDAASSLDSTARPTVVVVGLGPGDPGLVTAATRELIAAVSPRFLRTSRHPSATLVIDAPGGATSFDEHYDRLDTFEQVYGRIVDDLVAAAERHGTVLYAVPGSPLVLEHTVALLRRCGVELEIHPALSFLDEAWRALDIDPVESAVRLVDGHDFARSASGAGGALLIAHVHANWVLSDVKLSADGADDMPVVILHHLGLPDERVVHTVWSEIDRTLEADHLTSIYVPEMTAPVGREMVALHALARTLREQCPWDREQTHASLARYLLEETYEVLDAIENLDRDADRSDGDLIEELGDLLYQVQFHAAIAEEQGRFTIADVASSIHDKLVRRHPHVFGDVKAADSGDVEANWEAIKRTEKPERTGTFDGIVGSAPALAVAAKVQQRATRIGLDWAGANAVVAKLREELDELDAAGDDLALVDEEIGDLLFTVVNLARHLGIDPETSLRRSVNTFRRRVAEVERLAAAEGRDPAMLNPDELDLLWQRAKANLRTG